MRKRRIGTAKFFTLLLLLYHTSAKPRRFKRNIAGLDGMASAIPSFLCWLQPAGHEKQIL
ncbi:hypothetical protein D3Z52_25255 [Clostridiaceae bacterium]|nr:hypothetical protein [Clostridiaceae bacterium]